MKFKMKDGWWWYWTSGILMGMVFTIFWADYKFEVTLPVEAYVLLLAVFFFSVAIFVVGCIVKEVTSAPPSVI